MIYTARQLQDLHKTNGKVRLPVGARLTPMGADFVRARKIEILYGDSGPAPEGAGLAGVSSAKPGPSGPGPFASNAPAPANLTLWWCDGPCGQAKAALATQTRESNLQPMPIGAEPKHLIAAVKHLATEIKNDRAAAGIILVQSAASAVVFANRCPSLRAILGTCREAVQQGVEHLAANVLIIEHPYQALQQVRNLLGQFLRSRQPLTREMEQQLRELATCA